MRAAAVVGDAAGVLELTDEECELVAGAAGPAAALAMRMLIVAARTQQAPRLVPVVAAHVDSCLYHGRSSLDFVDRLIDGEGRVRVPTTLNVGGIDLCRPDLFVGPRSERNAAGRLMEKYVELGCQPTYTCAPYQLPGRPEPGADVAWAESNAVVFGNSMIGLRTSRYGDLIDICAAIAGRVPFSGLHVPENRAARMLFTVASDIAEIDADLRPALLGLHVGQRAGTLIPVLAGVEASEVTEDWGKAFGAAAASSGGVAMFHVAGVTPEAPDLDAALRGREPVRREVVTAQDLRVMHRSVMSAASTARLGGVSVGTPHLSRSELRALADEFAGRRAVVPTFATTSRAVVSAEPAAVERLEACGVVIVRDTCTYGPTRVLDPDGAMMTNSAKWAYYAPAHLGYQVVLASRLDCVESAVHGRIVIDSHHV